MHVGVGGQCANGAAQMLDGLVNFTLLLEHAA